MMTRNLKLEEKEKNKLNNIKLAKSRIKIWSIIK